MGGSKMDIRTSVGGGRLTVVQIALWALLGITLIVLPVAFQSIGNAFVVHVLMLVGIFSLLALGLNIVVGFAGLLDLGYVAFYGMGAYAGVLLGYMFQQLMGGAATAGAQFSYWALLAPAALVAAITGLALGTPVLRLRGDYLAIVTLGFGEIVRIALQNNFLGLTNGSAGLPRVGEKIVPAWGQDWLIRNLTPGNVLFPVGNEHAPDAFFRWLWNTLGMSGSTFSFSKDLFWYFTVALLCLLAIFIIRRLDNSRLGRAWVAMREDEVAAASVGVNIMATKLWAFALGAVWGGIGGITYAYATGFISPESFNFMESVLIVCMVVLGGMGSLPGSVLGAFIIVGLPELIRGLAQSDAMSRFISTGTAEAVAQYRYLLFGLLMVIMMAWRPQGIIPSKRRARELVADETVIDEENSNLWEVEHKHDGPSQI